MYAAVPKSGQLLGRQGPRLAAVVLSSILEPYLSVAKSARTRRLMQSTSPAAWRATHLDLLLAEGDAVDKLETRLLVRLGVVFVRVLEYHLVLGPGIGVSCGRAKEGRRPRQNIRGALPLALGVLPLVEGSAGSGRVMGEPGRDISEMRRRAGGGESR